MLIRVGWVKHPEYGELLCFVTEIDKIGNPQKAQWLKGKSSKIIYCHSQERYVWTPKN